MLCAISPCAPLTRSDKCFTWLFLCIAGLILAVLPNTAQAQNDPGQDLVNNRDLFDLVGNANASTQGQWSAAASWPIVGIHAALLPSGEIITYGTNPLGAGAGGFVYDVWDPEQGLRPASHITLDVQTDNNIFCAAQNLLPGSGGMLMVTGGTTRTQTLTNLGINAVNVFDPIDNSFFKPVDQMNKTRWYPNLTGLANGSLLVQGGRDGENRNPVLVPELFDPATGTWKLLTGAESSTVYGGSGWWYPRSFVAPNGKLFLMPTGKTKGYYLTTTGLGSLTEAFTFSRSAGTNSNLAAMYDTNKILNVRGTDARIVTLAGNGNVSEQNVADISSQRYWSDITILANGELLVTGGSTINQTANTATNQAEIWNPDTKQWRTGAAAQKIRLYHSTSILMPNGAVLTSGGGTPGPVNNMNAEVYYPDYLFEPNGDFRKRPRLLRRVSDGGGALIEVRAKGDEGTEIFNLVIGNQVVDSFEVTSEYQTYTYRHNGPVSGGQVEVEFINDEWNPPLVDSNLHVDYIRIDGLTYQTEHPNVVSLNLGIVGNAENESLYTNGYFRFWNRSANTAKGSVIEVRAAGDEGTERFRLKVDGQVLKTFSVSTDYQTYAIRHDVPVTGDQIELEFFNDQWIPPNIDSNLLVDFVKIDGKVHETENPNVFSFNLGTTGYFENEALYTNGFFQYWDRSEGYLQLGVINHGDQEKLFFDRAATIEKVMLVRFGSVTHSFDMGQMAFQPGYSVSGDVVTVNIPASRNTCPPGHYMLFIIDADGTPSRAAIMEIL